jgi:hypothetical protein
MTKEGDRHKAARSTRQQHEIVEQYLQNKAAAAASATHGIYKQPSR